MIRALARGPFGAVTLLGAALAAGAVALWAVVALALLAELPLPVPALYAFIVFFGVPPAVLLAAALGTGRAQRVVGPLAGWVLWMIAPLALVPLVLVQPLVLLVLPALAIAAFVGTRHRVPALVATFALSGAFGTVTALTPLRPGPTVDVLLIGLIAGFAWARATGRIQARAAGVWPGIVAVGAYLVASALAMLASPGFLFGLLSYRSSQWYLLAFLVVAYLPWRSGEVVRAARWMVVVATAVAGYAVLRWQIGPSGAEWNLALTSASTYNWVEGKLRAFGSFTSGHELAAWCSVVIPFTAAYALTFRDRWGLAAAGAAALSTVALFASEVRIGIIAIALGLAAVLVLHQFARGFVGIRLGTTATLVAGGALVALLAFASVVGNDSTRAERYANILTPDRDPAYQARVVKWETAMARLDGRPLGHGLGTAGREQRRSGRFVTVASANIDNAYLKIAWEQGYAVLALYVGALLAVLGGLVRRSLTTRDRTRAGLAMGAAGTLAAYMVLLFAAPYDEGLTALVAWIIVGLGVAGFVRRPPDVDQSRDPAYA